MELNVIVRAIHILSIVPLFLRHQMRHGSFVLIDPKSFFLRYNLLLFNVNISRAISPNSIIVLRLVVSRIESS